MGWFDSGGFTVKVDPSKGTYRFRVTFHGTEHPGKDFLAETVSKTDLLGMRREINRALKRNTSEKQSALTNVGEPEMSINIPAETPGESMNPISVEEFERLHPAMLGAIRKAVREELELSHADGRTSADVQRTFDLQLVVPDVPLVFGDALHGIGQRHDGLLNVSGLCVVLRVISGIHWIALHVITSLLCAGLLILPLGRKVLRRDTSEKQSALTNA